MIGRARTTCRRWLSIGGLVLLPLVAGCPQPQEKFDNFIARLPDMSGLDYSVKPSMVYNVTGPFLMGFAASVAPDKPIAILSTQKLTDNGDGTATLDLSLQPLTYMGLKPSGPPIVKTGIPVTATGTFMVDLGQQIVPADANPVTMTDLVATIQLAGTLFSADTECGDVTGMVTMPAPLDLAGSHFFAIRVTDMSNLPALPAKCPAAASTPDGGAPMDMLSTGG